MGKQKPKFENSVVYKIYCLDSEITDIYVGVTTNLKSKDYHHRKSCTVEGYTECNRYVHQFIKSHGGWEKWRIAQIRAYKTKIKNELQLHQKLCKYVRKLKPTLNKYKSTETDNDYKKHLENQANNIQAEMYKEHCKEIYQKERERRTCPESKIKRQPQKQQNNDTLLKRKGEKVKCECGSETRRDGMSEHCKTQKHKDYMKLI